HVPYVVLLLKYLEEFRALHGKLPSNYKEKSQLREMLRAGMRSADDENFSEADAAVMRSCSEPTIPSQIRDIFQDPSCTQLSIESSNFWIIARAISEFVNAEGNGLLPLSGTLPDMKSDTQSYVTLLNLYRGKAQQDIAAVTEHVRRILADLQLPQEWVTDSEIAAFCKHAAFVRVLRYQSLSEELQTNPQTDVLSDGVTDADSEVNRYVMFRAAERFYSQHGRYPGVAADDDMATVEQDAVLLSETAANFLVEMGVTAEPVSLGDNAKEWCRYGHAELHNVAALLGGMASQEVIKLITRQYVPLNNTCIYNGIIGATQTFQL
ncbi:putative amyloid beta precursor protein binding protein, partial [Thamnocephalis sphaerospora]